MVSITLGAAPIWIILVLFVNEVFAKTDLEENYEHSKKIYGGALEVTLLKIEKIMADYELNGNENIRKFYEDEMKLGLKFAKDDIGKLGNELEVMKFRNENNSMRTLKQLASTIKTYLNGVKTKMTTHDDSNKDHQGVKKLSVDDKKYLNDTSAELQKVTDQMEQLNCAFSYLSTDVRGHIRSTTDTEERPYDKL